MKKNPPRGDVTLSTGAVVKCIRMPNVPQYFNIAAINERTGRLVLLTGYPMPHKECCTMLSKMTGYKDIRRILIEAKQGA